MSAFDPSRRRALLGMSGFAALGLAACAPRPQTRLVSGRASTIDAETRAMYAAMPYEKFPIPRAEIEKIDPRYYRQIVPNPTGQRPGTVVVDTANRFLYVVRDDGQAMRYGVGVGRDGFSWSGKGYIGRKAEWPTWTPPAEMIEREPYLEEYRNGMAPGLENPLGARALYVYSDGKDTLYRLHGNNDPRAIGQAVSSGCIRLLNQDVIDLYRRVPVGTDIVVL